MISRFNSPEQERLEGLESLEGQGFDPFQARFHQRWQHLQDPDVRALAWLLDSPDLFDHQSQEWGPQLATLALPVNLDQLLEQLDTNPDALKPGLIPSMRLGRYAEKLIGYFLQQQGRLVAQGLQVRAGKNDTIGEFDFLLREPDANSASDALLHWEFATKFYLYDAALAEGDGDGAAGYFIGPNLSDSLAAKMRKIVQRQLALSQHPAAKAVLPGKVVRAQALVKGWLFYRESVPHQAALSKQGPPTDIGLSPQHCRGFWCTPDQLAERPGDAFVLLRRLRWLAPARVAASAVLSKAAMLAHLHDYFEQETMPVMLACLKPGGPSDGNEAVFLEAQRGFIVPNNWHQRAMQSYLSIMKQPAITSDITLDITLDINSNTAAQ